MLRDTVLSEPPFPVHERRIAHAYITIRRQERICLSSLSIAIRRRKYGSGTESVEARLASFQYLVIAVLMCLFRRLLTCRLTCLLTFRLTCLLPCYLAAWSGEMTFYCDSCPLPVACGSYRAHTFRDSWTCCKRPLFFCMFTQNSRDYAFRRNVFFFNAQ